MESIVNSKKKKKPINFAKPNAMAANFMLAHKFADRKKKASKEACKKKNWRDE